MYNSVKRLFDVLLALVVLLVLLPLMIPIVIALRLTGEGDIVYRPFRIGTSTFMLKSHRALGNVRLILWADETRFICRFFRVSLYIETQRIFWT